MKVPVPMVPGGAAGVTLGLIAAVILGFVIVSAVQSQNKNAPASPYGR